jgi:hypothetical protein
LFRNLKYFPEVSLESGYKLYCCSDEDLGDLVIDVYSMPFIGYGILIMA